MENPTTIAPLDYASAPWPWTKWICRGGAFLFVLLLGALAWLCGPWAWKQAQIKYWQAQCMSYTLSPDQVIVEQEPAAVAKLRAQGSKMNLGYYGDDTGRIHTQVSCPFPEPLAEYFQQIWPSFTKASASSHVPAIFMHRMVQPDGQPKLVTLYYAGALYDQSMEFDPDAEMPGYVFSPATLFAAPTFNYRQAPMAPLKTTPADRQMRIYAGQIDPDDPSHFTIRYRAWGQEDVMDGRLDNSGNVTIKPRNWPKPRDSSEQ